MTDGFIQKNDELDEKSQVSDSLGIDRIFKGFTNKIFSIEKPSIVALVGPFGSGKSTMLHQIMVERSGKEIWFEFDAWKYPDRKDLWEGFVLDLAKSTSPLEFSKAEKAIAGKQNDDKKTLISTLSRIPGLTSLEGLNHFMETSPAKRVDDIQKILKDLILKIKKDLFIILEDIDRSGDSGIFFLETLKQFLRTSDLSKKIIIIVPVANESYYKNIDSYAKCVDYFDFFEKFEIKLDAFVNKVFDEKLFSEKYTRPGDDKEWDGHLLKSQTISFLEGILLEMPGMNMRKLKLIIRKANLVFKNQTSDNQDPDFRVTLCIEACKYFKVNDNSDLNYFEDFKNRGAVIRGNIFSSFLYAILFSNQYIYSRSASRGSENILVQPPKDFRIIERRDDDKRAYPSHLWQLNSMFDDKAEYGIAKFYFQY